MDVNTFPVSPYNTILFCTDFSENADFAFDYAIDAARRRPGCVLYLLHVIPEPDAQFWKTYLYEVEDIDDKAKHDIDALLQERYLPRIPAGVDFRAEMCIGRDYLKILEFAREKQVDLIVMGRQGRGSIEKMLFGNVTERVARKAECAVLVVPLTVKSRGAKRAGQPAKPSE
ncbi:MAG TPA: universal stress protein [Candidatus Hydrogenedentes bacterium]|mgnify:CR=1 FL=1|nr:universal stress protein [Candidatus Hydrogenedentota bacterium]HPG69653.1 universal stress protein [Candidatus Hydrogenedentota bacterium]